ncbi:hypothetical protein [Dehalogenimonas etheniformans]|uniref:Uncharacterized protein n=1 Tax=Dehalogenimonas etheniformans TaxID=1536648 RepID=A0A2P5P5T2_9CHLR|nr:hypothetical protein [Dehalogenimonas etheniformans]PPD57647.1 hypothetical protein JP09_007860 [Dehalogenimonas etheniformans]QNT75989.1 hypothetical protein HX448_04445 [Dehalogenimonas etheniformans]
MAISKEQLIRFRDLKINLSDLNELGTINLFQTKQNDIVEVCNEHVANILECYLKGMVSEVNLLEWIYTIRWTDLYQVCESNRETILNILDELAERNIGRPNGPRKHFVDITAIVNKNDISEINIVAKYDINKVKKYIADLTMNFKKRQP